MPSDDLEGDTHRIWVTVECPECGEESDRVVTDEPAPEIGAVGRAECGHCGNESMMEVVKRAN